MGAHGPHPPEQVMSDQQIHQALALLFMTDADTADDLTGSVHAAVSTFDRDAAGQALAGLAELGLVTPVRRVAEEPTYARTTLGREYAHVLLTTDSPLAGRLAELEQLRTDFVATVSHELKTPLTAIRTCVGLLMDADVPTSPDTSQRLLDQVSASAASMQRLIEALLDLARSRTGSLPLELRWIDATEVAREALMLVSPLVGVHQQRVRLSAPETKPMLYGDRPRLIQALTNLLSNAQRFSPDGSTIEVTIRTDQGSVMWDVKDLGPGISEADQRYLFERFFRGRSDVGGSGLGLPIAQATAQAHGGDITVQSEVGNGSTFTLTIPINESWSERGD
jgi:signal transduction histidine kinase